MKQLREKIKTIIFNARGLPGLNKKEYMAAMRRILNKKLSPTELQAIADAGFFIDTLVTELSNEIAEEIL